MRRRLLGLLLLYFLIGWSIFWRRHLPGESLMLPLGRLGLKLLCVFILSVIHGLLWMISKSVPYFWVRSTHNEATVERMALLLVDAVLAPAPVSDGK
jgi:hypothetical protein